jgi:hypothetical protein
LPSRQSIKSDIDFFDRQRRATRRDRPNVAKGLAWNGIGRQDPVDPAIQIVIIHKRFLSYCALIQVKPTPNIIIERRVR